MRGHTKFLAQGERTEIAAVKVRIAHGFARFHACAHRVFDAPQRARQGKNYLNTRVFAARARRFVGVERQNDRFQHGNVFRHLRAVFEERAKFRPAAFTMCTRIERNIVKRYGGLFAALFAELFQRFTAQSVQNGNGQCGFFIGINLHRFAQIRRAAGFS